MEINEIDNTVWDTLLSGGKLADEQEKLIIAHIKTGDFKDAASLANQLRSNSQHLQQKSTEEMAKVIDSLKVFFIYDANQHFENAIKYEWQGAATGAQADRIDNTITQQLEAQKIIEVKQQAETAARLAQEQKSVQDAAAGAHAAQVAAIQRAVAAEPSPQLPREPVGVGSMEGSRAAIIASQQAETAGRLAQEQKAVQEAAVMAHAAKVAAQQAETAARLAQEQKSAQEAAAKAHAAHVAAIQRAVAAAPRPTPPRAPVGAGAREGSLTAIRAGFR